MSGSLHFWCGQPNMGLSLHSPSRHVICRGWDARDRLPVRFYPLLGSEVVPRCYLLARLTFFCLLGSRNVGEIPVLVRGRMPCCYHLDFCRLSRMRCLMLALRDSAPQTSGGPLYESLLFIRRLAVSPTRRSCSCRVVVNDTSGTTRPERARVHAERLSFVPAAISGWRRAKARPSGSAPELTCRLSFRTCYLVDPASSHMLVSKIKPCMCKYELIQTVKLRMAH
jgi:hypothetical protein